MSTGPPLAAVSTAQLAVQAAGLVVAVRRRLGYDFVPLGWRGDPDSLGRGLFWGTCLSAPGIMLAAQTTATAALRRGSGAVAERTLGFLGWAMIAGYLGERVVQQRLLRSEWDPVETPIAAAGLAGAATMAVLGLGTRRVRQDRPA